MKREELANKVLDRLKEIEIPMKGIVADMLKYSPSKIFGIAGNAVIIPIYTNILSPEQYGIYTLALAVLSFLCIIFSDWIGLSGLRFFRQNQLKERVPKYFSTLVMLLVTNLSVMFLLSFLLRHNFYEFFKISPKLFFMILFLTIPVAIRALLFQILRAQIKPSAFTISTIINQILTILISVLIIKNTNLGGISILVGMGISISIIDIILVFQSDILKHLKFEKFHPEILVSILKYGTPIATASLGLWIITQSNKFISNHFHGFVDVGLIGVGYSITFPILMTLFSIITIAAFPRIINMHEEKIDVRPIISKLTGYFLLMALPLIVMMSLYSQELVLLMANKKFAGAYILIPYLAFSTLFLSLSDYTTMQYHLANKTYIDTAIKVSSGLIGLILNYFLIKEYGILGVGIAALISNIIYFLLSIIVVVGNLSWKVPWGEISKIVATFIPFAVFYYFLHNKTDILVAYQMIILLAFYYLCYFCISKLLKYN